ncbi:MAG: hypothetical protein ACPL4E_11005 [Thermoproteota archaeon]
MAVPRKYAMAKLKADANKNKLESVWLQKLSNTPIIKYRKISPTDQGDNLNLNKKCSILDIFSSS